MTFYRCGSCQQGHTSREAEHITRPYVIVKINLGYWADLLRVTTVMKVIKVTYRLRYTNYKTPETNELTIRRNCGFMPELVLVDVFEDVLHASFHKKNTVLGFKYYGLLEDAPHDFQEGFFL